MDFFGNDMFMDNGFGMGNDIIIDNGFMGTDVIIDNGYGMGTDVIIDNGGFFGRQEDIIINNGYGMGTTEIIEQRGLFGTREEVIVNNSGWGTNTTIVETGPFENGYQNPTFMGYGGYGGYGRNDIVACLPNCTCQICIVRTRPPVYQSQQPTYKQQQNVVRSSPYGTDYNEIKKQELLMNETMLELRYEKWSPRACQLTNKTFDKYHLSSLRKLKCRTNYEPFSNSLENGEIVLKTVVGTDELFFAAPSNQIRQYFITAILLRLRPNHQPSLGEYQGEICGPILKKSEFLGNWEVRQVKITKGEGLKSYKKASQNHTLHIQSTKQIWTWFEIIQGSYLVIKLKNKIKTEFGIPITHQLGPWLEAFFSLLEDYQ